MQLKLDSQGLTCIIYEQMCLYVLVFELCLAEEEVIEMTLELGWHLHRIEVRN